MEFSSKHNAIHSSDSAAALLATMCKHGMCAEQASEMLRAAEDEKVGEGRSSPGSDWLLGKLGAISYDDMYRNTCRILRKTVTDAMQKGLIDKSPIVAIDKTMISRYDKNPDMTHLIKCKGRGTDTAEGYATASIVGAEVRVHLGGIPVIRGEFNPYFVRKMLDQIRMLHIKPSLILLDREFYAVDVMQKISRAGQRFLMPATNTTGIKKAMKEHADGKRDAVFEYQVKAQNGDSFRCTLVIAEFPNPKGSDPKRIPFVTNMKDCSMEDLLALPEEYRKRWGIETGYRDAKRVMSRTTSRNDSIRLGLFFLALVISNIWAIVRSGDDDNGIKLVVLLAYMISSYVNDARPCKPPDPGGG